MFADDAAALAGEGCGAWLALGVADTLAGGALAAGALLACGDAAMGAAGAG